MHMNDSVVVNVSTDSWVRGQQRLGIRLRDLGQKEMFWTNCLPKGSPCHRDRGICGGFYPNCRPYSFKSYALKEAADRGHKYLLWCDASVVPVKSLDPLWEKIAQEGVWICRNGWTNAQWTADEAYPELFAQHFGANYKPSMEALRAANSKIPHVVATAFGLSMEHEAGRAFLTEYFRLASETKAFCGPWQNTNAPMVAKRNEARPAGPCGPPEVLGHRHDQSAASVIAWRLGVKLDDPPAMLAYEGGQVESTILVVREI